MIKTFARLAVHGLGIGESHDAYVRGRLIGREPDPAIRARLRSEHYLYAF